jgi:hypothetical protein
MARSTHTYSTSAIVLRNRNLGEKDRIMTLLSPEIGKFSAVAKGARAPKSKLAAVSQSFTHARFLVARGRSLDIATQPKSSRRTRTSRATCCAPRGHVSAANCATSCPSTNPTKSFSKPCDSRWNA